MTVDPVLFHMGPLMVHWYGMMIAIGVLVAAWLSGREFQRRGFSRELVYDLGLWVILAGFLGVRLYYDIQSGENYWEHPSALFAYSQGGLAIYGGLFGGLLAVVIYARVKRISFWSLADGIAPTVALAQAIGRIGCTINGDIAGDPTGIPFGIVYTQPAALARQKGIPLWPTSIFEMIWDVLIFAVLWRVRKRMKRDGVLLAAYAVLYSIGRLWIGFLRGEPIIWLGLQQQQITAIAVIIGAGALWVYLLRRRAPTTPAAGSLLPAGTSTQAP